MKAKPEVVPSSMVTTWGTVLETFMITGLSFSARFSLSDHEDSRSDLGNCMIYGPSCLLGGSASGAQLTPATLSPLCPGSILWYSSLWCRVRAKIFLIAYKVLPSLPHLPLQPCLPLAHQAIDSHDLSGLSPDTTCLTTLPNVALAEPLTPNPNFSIASPHFIVFISLIGAQYAHILFSGLLSVFFTCMSKACNK